MDIKYVATLAFSQDLRKVVLIKKNRPQWLAGKWNAIGGHVEPSETPADAAMRELVEEAGLYVADYTCLVPFSRIDWIGASSCLVYATVLPNIFGARTKTDEEVMVWFTAEMSAYHSDLAPDLCALVEMAKMALRAPRNSVFFVQQRAMARAGVAA